MNRPLHPQMQKNLDSNKSPKVCAQLAQDKARATQLLSNLLNSKVVYVSTTRTIRVN